MIGFLLNEVFCPYLHQFKMQKQATVIMYSSKMTLKSVSLVISQSEFEIVIFKLEVQMQLMD